MPPTALPSLAARKTGIFACVFLVAAAQAALRPRYGGTLRVHLRSWTATLDPSAPGDSPARQRLSDALYEGLIALDEKGQPRPGLAAAWQIRNGRMSFRLRPGVRFHDGTPLTAADAARALEGLQATVQDEALVIPRALPLAELARPRYAIVKPNAEGPPLGTGPFRLAAWQPERRAVLQANLAHWAGRPFLDEVRIEMGRNPRDSLLELEVGRADVAELTPAEARRAVKLAQSLPVELIALRLDPSLDAAIREALALSIDRTSIHQVLLQRQGAPAGSLLPQWLSGYAHLFPAARDLPRARQLARAQPIVLGYDAVDPLARSIAERIAVNAREAGLTVRTAAGESRNRVARLRITSPDPALALSMLAQAQREAASTPEAVHNAEAALLKDFSIVPLFHLPDSYALSRQVHNWKLAPWGSWDLADVWLAP